MDVGQTEVATGIAKRQLLVIKSKAMQHGGVQIMHANGIVRSLESDVVGCAVRRAAFDPATRQPDAEAPVIVIPTRLRFPITR